MHRFAAFLLLLAPLAAGDTADDLVDRLFHENPAVRAAARKKLAALGDGALERVLQRIEARQARSDVLHIYALGDFKQDETWWNLALARVRTVVGSEGDVVAKGEGGTLIVHAPEEVQARVAEELTVLRRALGRMVTLQVRYVRFAKAPAVERVPLDTLDAFLAEHEAEVVSAPQLTTRNGQRATVSILHEVSYVADFDVQIAKDGLVADPVVSTAHEGVSVELRAVVDGKAVRIALEAKRSELERPLPTMPLSIHGVDGATIQVPVGRSRTLVRLLTCEPGAATLVDLGDGDALLLSAQPIDLTEATPPVIVEEAPK